MVAPSGDSTGDALTAPPVRNRHSAAPVVALMQCRWRSAEPTKSVPPSRETAGDEYPIAPEVEKRQRSVPSADARACTDPSFAPTYTEPPSGESAGDDCTPMSARVAPVANLHRWVPLPKEANRKPRPSSSNMFTPSSKCAALALRRRLASRCLVRWEE